MEKMDIVKAYNEGKRILFKKWISTSPTPRGSGNHAWGVYAYGEFQKFPTQREKRTEVLDGNWKSYICLWTFEQTLADYPNETVRDVTTIN